MPKTNIQKIVQGGSGGGDLKSTEKSNGGWWAPIWSGLTTDPQHQKRMGNAIWVYLYLHTYANRKTGQLFRNYNQIAEETGRSFNTIRRQIEKLEGQGYIELKRKQYGFLIQITKWKPIKKIKGLALVEYSGGGEDGSSRVPTSEHSEPVRVPKGEHSEQGRLSKTGQSENPQSAQFCNPECPSVESRVPRVGQSPIRKFKESNKKRLKKVVAGETVSVDREVVRFLNFAGRTHKTIRHCSLFISGDSDREKVKALINQVPCKTLCFAWMLFMHSRDEYIVAHYPSRNIAVFKAQLRNFLPLAEKKLAASQAKRLLKARSREPTMAIDPVQVKKWNQCLYEIESQINPDNYSRFFPHLVFEGVANGKGVIVCPDRTSSRVISENYQDLIDATMTEVFEEDVNTEIVALVG